MTYVNPKERGKRKQGKSKKRRKRTLFELEDITIKFSLTIYTLFKVNLQIHKLQPHIHKHV